MDVYDILHAPGTRQDFASLRRIANRFAGAMSATGAWLEPACGTGRLVRAAERAGIRCVGFDSNPEMVRYARRSLAAEARRRGALQRGRILHAEMTDFLNALGRTRADFAFNPINTIRHLASDAQMLSHLSQVAQALKPHGAYAVGLSTSAYGLEMPSEDVWEGHRGNTHVKQVVQYLPPARGRFEQVHSHLVITRGKTVEHRDSSYRLRCYSTAQWERLIGRSDMVLAAVVDEEGQAMKPPKFGYAIWILRPRLTRS